MKPFAYREREEDDFEIIETYQKKINQARESSSSDSDFEIIETYQDVLKRRESKKNIYPQPSNGIEAVGRPRNSMNNIGQLMSPKGQINRPPSVSMNNTVISSNVSNLDNSQLHNHRKAYVIYDFKPDFELEYIKRVEHEVKMEEEEEKRQKIQFNLLLQTLNAKSNTERNLMSPTLININENIIPLPSLTNPSRPPNSSTTTVPQSSTQTVQSSSGFTSPNLYSSSFNEPTFPTEAERDSYNHAIEIGFSPDISFFATEAYKGDKIKILDFLDKHKQLSEMNFKDLDIREALLLTDRSLDQSLDLLVQKSPNHYQPTPNFYTSPSQPSNLHYLNY
ncbi:hypothetical protein C9374_012540 [Naegleria lovaniensis]|uniref:UBA domain-containing protein n=1 Tax=Naegleria lovaniensis TaxID=51637 RepID=A0AA88KNM5_NAELO|nr:uncharacterized protein C9374_012540 [Naegleria lovaniensis]KAG2392288.1 hypothetical protein C9374_012540 [Naegleria lovaniensis]